MRGSPSPEPAGGRRRWAVALLLSLLVPVAAPFLGVVRDVLVDGLGEEALALLLGLAGVAALALLSWLAARLREPFREGGLARWAALGGAVALVVAQLLLWGTGDRRVDLVERIHLAEYGLLAMAWLWALRPRHRSPALPVLALLAAGLVGIADEWVQWASAARVGDVRDVLLDFWAGAVGVCAAVALLPPRAGAGDPPIRPGPLSARLALRLAAVTVLAAGAFVACAHLGHRIEDPVTGSFLSYHSADELARARNDRARRWERSPPPEPAPLVLEDYFLTEAGAHAGARNDAWEAGDLAAAWRENLILERWYTPFLDLPSFATGEVHRWPPEQRRHAAEAAGARGGLVPPGRIGSPVYEDRIVTPPRTLFWGLVVLVSGGLAWASGRVGRW